MGNYKMLAKTLHGFEELLAKELRNLGAGNVTQGVRTVFFEGDKGFMYKANLCLRTAIKVLKPITSFTIRQQNDLYNQIYAMDWEAFMHKDQTFVVDTVLLSDEFSNSLFVSQKVKDAIVDKFRDQYGTRPSVDTKHADIRINIHIQGSLCHVSLDSSGASLHHRGYRLATNIAPINEVLAAGLLLMSGWDGRSDFLDPMCGSGTFLVEAAMIACNIPPNINRKEFCFKNWKDFDPELYNKIVEASLNKAREFHFKIKGYDKAPSAVLKAKDNVENAGLSDYITIEEKSFFDSEKESDSHLHMVFNPPYGTRLQIDMPKFYGQIGDTLKQNYPGTEAWFISSNMEALKHVGLRTSRKIKVYNSQLESRFVKYEIYSGSKKAKHQAAD
ncbi:THUMP domain-containing protein [Zeaxanthinibacter sp. PT1]|nr:THUMP domain-containing protein [Zeaxanthinibacter sp. PT1]MDC6351779.1 THUMP domain-containing protein [Zeaxanthinibacter sp. PT1]